MSHCKGVRGSAMLEFSLIGIPTIFLLISVADLSFGMMTMHTMQEAVEQGARYVVTRGSTCSSGTNSCTVTVQQIAATIAAAAAGISPSQLQVTLTTNSGAATTCTTLSSCLASCATSCNGSRATVWPPSGGTDNSPGSDVIITADYNFTSLITMFWPRVGGASVSNTSFHAKSRQRLMF